jgi:hypothetical protein
MTRRAPAHRYQDPLDLVWIAAAAELGFRIEASDEVYASSDGQGAIRLASAPHRDADDCLAQMLLHELCHALVEGEAGRRLPDWGLDNTTARDTWREHACLRLQAWLTLPWGLRDFFAPTTDHRLDFWPRLPPGDPFATWPDEAPWAEAARRAARRAARESRQPPWQAVLDRAFASTRAIADAVTAAGSAASALPALWATVEPRPPLHPASALPLAAPTTPPVAGCRDCAWGFRLRGVLRCRRNPVVRLADDAPACLGHEPMDRLDCRHCAACCREAYDCVEIAAGERLLRRHPGLASQRDGRFRLRREGGHCVALAASGPDEYACRVYRDRPRACREFTAASANCLDARQRTGLSL